ncbi:1-acylglycerol-3-phosphate O-acyltransferase [Fusobacterium animalis 7_1]|uniref:1-acylglycerol-3-phosphate O-acyltransferase n=1 Tax=Fusobacterium animalis 7_1 TaxID=457405 RepID=A0A140PRH2_9FUSO|nr:MULTISPECIES: AMP-binding protein [Fusobacterium]EEO42067.1 1-acylglycerol-3-phosphate O-acyltransferase [Fusobacterium animalis 7_1]EHG18466.2 1-acylglycerol-3-phosphate O-acyltransferase [Fusobacterium polymorphum F0401]ERT41041.1 acyl carrier protein [Fusobacterium nucleatum CTI-1]
MSIKYLYDRKRIAVTYGEQKISYADVIKYANYYSEFLDITKGDRSALMMENRPESIFSFFSIWAKKGIAISLDAGYTVDQLAYVLGDSTPKYLFVSNKTKKVAEEANSKLNNIIKIINVDELVLPAEYKIKKEEFENDSNDDVAVIVYTSGTTGNPKGVMITYENIKTNMEGVRAVDLVNETDVILAMLPYHHIMPLCFTLILPMYMGVPIVLLTEISSASLLKTLQENRVTVILGVPRVWEMLDKAIMIKINESSLAKFMFKMAEKINSMAIRKMLFSKVHKQFGGHIRLMVSGGAKIDKNILEDFRTMGFCAIQGYGMTETAPIIAFNVPGRERSDSAGEVIPNVEVKIADDGEILVKGKNVMKGYYNNEKATEEAFDKDGWFHTGDLGRMDGKYLIIIGRKKEMIVLPNGKNIDPNDIENEIIKNTDLIKEIAVTEYKEQLLAIIYPDFQQIEAKKIVNIKDAIKWEVIDKYNVTAPNYKKIHDIKIVKKELPKTRIGKIRRFMLKDLIEDKDDVIEQKEEKKAIVVPPEMKEKFDIINKYIDERYHKAIDLDSHIELDLGFDSLDIVEFMNFLNETFGINLVEQDFVENKTISAIIKLVNEKAGKFVEKVDKNENLKKIIESDSDVKLPKDARYAKFLRVILGPFFRFYFKYKCIDKENIKDGAGIIVGNHQSYLDGFMVNNVFTTKEMNDNYYIATALHFKSKTMKYLANHGNIILVDANRNLKNTLQAAAKVLKNNKKLIIFPEGARTRDGQIHEFKKTFAILAKDLNVPIYPFVLKGAYEAFPYNKKFPKRNNVSVQFLERIEPNNKTVEELVEETKNNIAKNYY